MKKLSIETIVEHTYKIDQLAKTVLTENQLKIFNYQNRVVIGTESTTLAKNNPGMISEI